MVVNQSLLLRALIYLDRHDLARAEAMLAEVEPRLRKALPPGHYAFTAIPSEQSLIDLARGDLPAALQHANQAIAIYEAAMKAGKAGEAGMQLLLLRRSTIELQPGLLMKRRRTPPAA